MALAAPSALRGIGVAGTTALGALIALLSRDLRGVPVAAQWEEFARTQGLAARE